MRDMFTPVDLKTMQWVKQTFNPSYSHPSKLFCKYLPVTIAAMTIVLVGIVSIPSNTVASPSTHSQAECKEPAPLKAEAVYGFALNAPTKSEALELLKKAEECYRIEGNQAGINKTRNQIANIDKINFAKNKREALTAWKKMASDYRKEGRNEEAAKLEARIRELEKPRN